MTIDQAIAEYQNTFGEKHYSENKFLTETGITPSTYMERLSNRVKKVYDVHPGVFVDKHVLDYGANLGDQSFILKGIASKVSAFDANPMMAKTLKTTLPDSVGVIDGLNNVITFSYDTVFCSSVINLQRKPYEFFRSLFDIDMKTLVLIYHDGFTHPMKENLKMWSPDKPPHTSSLVEKQKLLDICAELGLIVVESDLTWVEDVPIDDIKYTQSVLIVEKP